MNEIERVDVLKHLILDIPLDKQNIIELRSKAEVHLEHIRTALTELAEIKQRAEEVKRQILDMNSYGGKSVRNKIDYILKGETK